MAQGKDTALLACIVTLGVAALLATGQRAEQPEVETKYGRVRGFQFKVDTAERSVNVFLGLPFAKPPLGSLRFSEPQPPEPWKGVRDATSYPPMCVQDPVQGQYFSDLITNRKEKVPLQVSEDCLYLNVYTPVPAGEQQKLPVFVWIHGGGLVLGAASTYDGSALAAFENVVVVTIQYRLGVLGYLSTGDKHARGNWGYLDQVAALQWIQENIKHFGGDPGSVTITGESAGGISVSALVISPLAKGLFHKAISESGTALLGLFTDQPKEEAHKIAAVSGCEKSSSAAIVECLREKTKEEIIELTLKMDFFFISSCVDGVFFPKSPRQLLSEKSFNAVPYMIGVNNGEFTWGLPMMMKYPPLVDGLDKNTAREILQSSLVVLLKGATSAVVDGLYSEYIGNADSPAQVRDSLLEALGDVLFVFSSIEVAKFHRGHATEEENKLSRTVMKYWTNFARTGNPNGEGLVHWPQYDLDEKYLEIDLKQKAAEKFKQGKMKKQGSGFAAKDWCEEADDWGAGDGAEPPACASLLGLGEAVSSSLARELECASQLQQLCLAEPAEGSGPQNTRPAASEEMAMETPDPAPAFQPFYISVVDEEDYRGFLDTHHADELLKEYQQREGVDLEQMMSESFAGEGGNEKYEKSEVKSWDHTFYKFMKRISVCPEQILRYSWGGQPLFITSPPADITQGIPACSVCGSSRVFELQLMPALVSLLHTDSGALP
ncbi:Fatty acyl-CoA hydrolase precursor, medium chain [Pitangus sulphuratus]|nr:Fatty acyl-CoA hydrolase precursor, medium chain [Pitangus sulphuratus]